MKQTTAPSRASFFASYLVIAILVSLPVYTLLATWLGSNFGHLDLFRILKELCMLPLGVYAAYVVAKNRPLLREWAKSWLVILILVYGLLTVNYALVSLFRHSVATNAVLYGLISNLRFLWFMLVVWAVCYGNPLIRRYWVKIVLVPASAAIGFGLLQKFMLPNDFLRHFGYGPKTIPAIETVDQKLSYQRIQSSLRGANPFGAYLVLVLTTTVAYIRRSKYMWALLATGLTALLFTYSRSAWIGLIISLSVYGWLSVTDPKQRRVILAGVAGLGLLLVLGAWAFRHNTTIQNTVFHSDNTSHAKTSSNTQRAGALEKGWHDVEHEPFGRGVGTAGPASVRNGTPRIAENYYLQIGQEVGWLGLSLFLAINLLVAHALWIRSTPLARVLLASFIGLTVVNMISHAWADDTLSLLWWGLAGVALSTPAIMNKE